MIRSLAYLFSLIGVVLFAQEKSSTPSPEQILQRLQEGNERYMKAKLLHPDRSKERRKETATGQNPFAIILSCADSRVAPEIIFDQGIGDLFVVRVAGNVLGPVELDSIEYAALYLNSPLILVMGHENCGAVKAVMAGKIEDIQDVADLITPVIDMHPHASVEETIKANASYVAKELKNSPPLRKLIKQGRLTVRSAYYDFVSGRVELLSDAKQ